MTDMSELVNFGSSYRVNVKMLVQNKMRNKSINNRLFEDLLDDIEARSSSASKRIADDADEDVRHDVDDATYFDYTFFIESSDMEKY